MKTLSIYLFAFSALLITNSCKKDNQTTSGYSDVGIRVLNETPWTFYDCTVDPTQTLSINPTVNAHNYGQISVNSVSLYYSFPINVYRYSWVRLTMNKIIYYLLPIDYTYDKPLVNGRYTYKISYEAVGDKLTLVLIND